MLTFNIWRWQAKDKDGKLVEAAPGQPFFESRGPADPNTMKREATRILNMRRRDAVLAGYEDPGYALVEDSVKGVGHSDRVEEDDDLALGKWKPKASSAVPVDLPTDKGVRKHHDKLIAEKLGVPTDNA